eukprot:355359-Chlamydomonas_euryale.AAC.10
MIMATVPWIRSGIKTGRFASRSSEGTMQKWKSVQMLQVLEHNSCSGMLARDDQHSPNASTRIKHQGCTMHHGINQ